MLASLLAGLTLLVAAASAPAAAASPPIALRVSVPDAVSGNQPRDVSVVISNRGSSAVLVLPRMVRLHIEGSGAEYVPYPGPPIDPWSGARSLVPGASVTVELRDTSDGRGVWRLPPGTYRITARYAVPADLLPPAAITDAPPLWRDRVESPPAVMTVR